MSIDRPSQKARRPRRGNRVTRVLQFAVVASYLLALLHLLLFLLVDCLTTLNLLLALYHGGFGTVALLAVRTTEPTGDPEPKEEEQIKDS